MSLVEEIAREATEAVSVAATSDGLHAIRRPGCAGAIWRRTLPPGFQAWIEGLEAPRLPQGRVLLSPEHVRDAAVAMCDASGTPDCPERDWLLDDVAALAEIVAGLTTAPYLQLRFDVVTNNACRKFHIDAVMARLVCTYRGTGTQYGISIDGAEPGQISTVTTGSPILLRGTLWPERPITGPRHRSPPIEGTGETRLLLVLDPATSLENEEA